MTPRSTQLDERLERYVLEVGLREIPAQAELRVRSDQLPESGMRSSAIQIALLQWLLRASDARAVLEIGTFTGYGSLGLALALPDDGEVVTLDYSEDWPAVGRPFWDEAGVAGRITLMTGLAIDNLDRLIAQGRAGSFDLVYIDADKKNYELYLERARTLTRARGLIALDNVLWGGAVADDKDTSRQTATLRRINRMIAADPGLDYCLLPIGDGLTIARKLQD